MPIVWTRRGAPGLPSARPPKAASWGRCRITDAGASFDGGLLVIGCICALDRIARLCIHHDRELEAHANVAIAE